MLELKEKKYFINNSTSLSFLAECSDNAEWVIRLKKKGKNSKRLFSEYLAGKLARYFGISRPRVSLVKLNQSSFYLINSDENLFDSECKYGVAVEYIKELFDIGTPTVDSFLNDEFPQKNVEFLNKKLQGSPNFDQIFGLKVFSHWIYLNDYHKYENLKTDKNRRIYFLDFDLAFSSNYGEWEVLELYDWIKIRTDQAPFWEGYTDKIELFEKWLERLIQLNPQKFVLTLDSIPECWGVPENYLTNTLDFIFGNRNLYVKEFRHAIEFNKEFNQSLKNFM